MNIFCLPLPAGLSFQYTIVVAVRNKTDVRMSNIHWYGGGYPFLAGSQ